MSIQLASGSLQLVSTLTLVRHPSSWWHSACGRSCRTEHLCTLAQCSRHKAARRCASICAPASACRSRNASTDVVDVNVHESMTGSDELHPVSLQWRLLHCLGLAASTRHTSSWPVEHGKGGHDASSEQATAQTPSRMHACRKHTRAQTTRRPARQTQLRQQW